MHELLGPLLARRSHGPAIMGAGRSGEERGGVPVDTRLRMHHAGCVCRGLRRGIWQGTGSGLAQACAYGDFPAGTIVVFSVNGFGMAQLRTAGG